MKSKQNKTKQIKSNQNHAGQKITKLKSEWIESNRIALPCIAFHSFLPSFLPSFIDPHNKVIADGVPN